MPQMHAFFKYKFQIRHAPLAKSVGIMYDSSVIPIFPEGKYVMKAIMTVIGPDRAGIVAGVSALLASLNINILDISQTVMEDFFTMIMVVDMNEATISFNDMREQIGLLGQKHGVVISCQHEEIFQYMHRI